MDISIHIPTHIAIIMDGNRRWARERNFPDVAGHQKVANKILEPLIEYAAKRGVKYMTFWAWSTENWERSQDEVTAIMTLFRHVIHKQWQRLHEKGVKIQIIGDISKFPEDIRKSLEAVVEQTKHNTVITTVFALNYGGRDEMIRAIHKIEHPKLIDESGFNLLLDTQGIPDPDMIVRTGGEQRLSGFFLWQSEYSELYFPSWYMPEFTSAKLDEIIMEFQHRQRRFGK
jgi:undecaprenyl diphosphate synthase